MPSKQIESLLRDGSTQDVELKTEAFTLMFDRDGRPVRLLTPGQAENKLLDRLPSQGFVATFTNSDGKVESRLNRVMRQGRWLLAANEQIVAIFEVEETSRYATLDLRQVVERNGSRVSALKFELNCEKHFKAWPLDAMTEMRKHGVRSSANWDWLWDRNDNNPLGKVAISAPQDELDEDDILLKLWVNEGLPHPNVDYQWTERSAKNWLANWQQKFVDQSTMVIQPSDEAELYELASLASDLDVKRIYLHTDVWRGEYWPRERSFLNVNRRVFGKGQASLAEFAKHLRGKEIGIALHMVSGAIAYDDPDYAGNTLDPQLASFAEGELASELRANAKSIVIRLDQNRPLPKIVGRHDVGPNSYPSWMDINCFQIGDDVIVARQHKKRSDGLVELTQISRLSRGVGNRNKALPEYPRKTRVRGLLRPYGQVFTANVDSSLLDKIAQRYAGFCNRNHINHLECDALEIHQSKPWGPSKFAWKIYENIDHPCTSNTSSGKPLPFHIEYWFNSSKRVRQNRPQGGVAGGDGISILLDSEDRVATGPYGRHVKPTIAFTKGGQSVNLIRPVPMFGVSKTLLKAHGLSEQTIDYFQHWKTLLSANGSSPNKSPAHSDVYMLNQRMLSNHPAMDCLLRPVGKDAELKLQPFDVMRPADSQIKWSWGQEFGPLVPRTYFKSGDRGKVLNNPFRKQEPEVLLRIMPSFSPHDLAVAIEQTAKPSETPDAKIPADKITEQYRTGVEGQQTKGQQKQGQQKRNPDQRSSSVGENVASSDGFNLMPANARSVSRIPEQTLELSDGRHILSAANMTNTTQYFLDRTSWPVNLNLANSRALEITVTGDNSGAVLVVTLGRNDKRDYVVPVDFKGRRAFLIPSGEVAWSDTNWGWRKSARHFDYQNVRMVEVGFGTMPPKCESSITIESIRAVQEKRVEISDVKVRLGSGSLTIQGPLQTGNYVWFTGGNNAIVFDSNWHKLRDVPVSKVNFLATSGEQEVSIESSGATPYLEAQLVVSGGSVD